MGSFCVSLLCIRLHYNYRLFVALQNAYSTNNLAVLPLKNVYLRDTNFSWASSARKPPCNIHSQPVPDDTADPDALRCSVPGRGCCCVVLSEARMTGSDCGWFDQMSAASTFTWSYQLGVNVSRWAGRVSRSSPILILQCCCCSPSRVESVAKDSLFLFKHCRSFRKAGLSWFVN